MPWNTRGDTSVADSSVIGSFPAIAMIPVSSMRACGRYCLRTRDPRAIRTDQQIARRSGAVGEVCSDRAVGVLLEAGELLAEGDHVLQAGHQYLAQGHPADRLLALDRIVLGRDLERKHFPQLLSDHVEPAWRAGTRGHEGVVQIGRQQGMQRSAAVGIDTNAVAVEALGAQPVAFEDAHVDSCPYQPVGQCEAAGAGTDHQDSW